MKFTALAAVLLALGVVLGLVLAKNFDRPASADPKCPGPSAKCPTPTATATPTPPQRREAELTIIAGGGVQFRTGPDGIWRDARGRGPFTMPIDPARFPSGSFQLELGGNHQRTDPAGTVCVRLAEKVGPSRVAVTGSEVCSAQKGDFFIQSRVFALPSGERMYTLQLQSPDFFDRILDVELARVVVEWTE